MKKLNDVKILNQCVDTLKIGIRVINENIFDSVFKNFKKELLDLKSKAKEINTYGDKFIKSDFNLGFGEFRVYSRGLRQYFARIENSDVNIKISDVKFNSTNFYHLEIEFKSIFLLRYGHIKAHQIIKEFLDKLFISSSNYKEFVLRIDLATDVSGIIYEGFDYLRFRTLKKISSFIDNIEITSSNDFMRFNKINGISFGKNPFMFRIYNKSSEVKGKEHEFILSLRWANNGLKSNEIVYRHEVEFGREYIKSFIPKFCDNEVDFIFNSLNSLWDFLHKNIRYYDLTFDEIKRIHSNTLKSNSISKIYERCEKNEDRFKFWSFLKDFRANSSNYLSKQENPICKNKNAIKKALKALISTTYKNAYPNLDCLLEIYDEVEKELLECEKISLHQYGLIGVMDSFIKNEQNNVSNNPFKDDIRSVLCDLIDMYKDDSVSKEFKRKITKVRELI